MFERLNTQHHPPQCSGTAKLPLPRPIHGVHKENGEESGLYRHHRPERLRQQRNLHEELVLIFFSFLHKSYLHYYTPLKQFLNDDTYQYRHADESELSKLEAQFKKSVDIIKTVFGRNAFKVFLIDPDTGRGYFSKTKINQGLYFVLTYCFALYEKNQIMPYSDLIREELINLQVRQRRVLGHIDG